MNLHSMALPTWIPATTAAPMSPSTRMPSPKGRFSLRTIRLNWSPPGWMKTKDTMTGGQLRVEDSSAFAGYLVKSVSACEEAGVPVRYLSLQNEPLYETKDYPGTLMLADQQTRLIGDFVGPALRKAGLKTNILAYDHNWDHPEYPAAVLSDPSAA